MFEKQKGEVVVTEGAAETIVGTSVKLKGNLKSDGDVIIDGVVTGEVRTKGSVKIGPNANIIANVKAKNVSVSGAVQGNVEAADRLEISETGKVLGDISANVLSIAPGAVFSGKSVMVEVHKEDVTEPVAETEEIEEEKEKEEK
jgi:cytoskeletal protein CcmA (bactofilin family)